VQGEKTMRDNERITRITDKIKMYWTKNPDMRFNQLLINLCIIPDGTHWNMPDEDVEKMLDENVNKL